MPDLAIAAMSLRLILGRGVLENCLGPVLGRRMPDQRKLQPEMKRDRAVRIIAGPFAASAGMLVSTNPNGTAEVRLVVAGEEVVVQMSLADCVRNQ